MGKGNQPLMGCNSEEGGGSLALYGVHFSPCLPLHFLHKLSGALIFFFPPALTRWALPGLS